ncbi:hypothetical protein B0T16DRAFT_388027 [Cercophora newfieldiana]|uniref:Zn(2)-C6 fungal-type domain-containing protein n=1 Tax=Cercophora newfieldiana TaxID=92897 RepID=A0AA39YIY6_9PEZI|nr:hypothetical protein B0T16DRAFT_388027 [Cercophora newfieldiana]
MASRVETAASPQRQGEAKRSTKGCLTCRDRRVKCNEEHPVCGHCTRLKLKCEWRGKHVPLKERRALGAKRRPPRCLAPHQEFGVAGEMLATQPFYGTHLWLPSSDFDQNAVHCPTSNTFNVQLLNVADGHYERGRSLLAKLLEGAEPDPLVVVASFWFLYLHQRRWHSERRACYAELSAWMSQYLNRRQLHLELLVSREEDTHGGGNGLTLLPNTRAILARLTIWLFWADTQASLVGGGQMARLLAHTLSPHGMLSLHEISRGALQLYWGTNYPDDEVADDLLNAGAIELVHHMWVLVQEINEHVPSAPMDPETSRDIDDRLDALRQSFTIRSVFRLAESPTAGRGRLITNSDWAVANYHAVRIYNFRCSITEERRQFGGDDGDINETVAALVLLLQRSLATNDRQQIDRLQWPLVWAGVETTEPFKQNWILSMLSNPVARDTVQSIIEEQQNGTRVSMQRMCEICRARCETREGAGSRGTTPLFGI